jgi:hypothetical protein
LHGGANHCEHNGYTALGKRIGSSKSTKTGHKDFLGEQFVNCRPFRSHHQQVRMDFVFFIPPPPFFEGTRAEFDTTLENCWYGRVVLLFRIRVKTDEKDRNGRSVLMDCDCAMIDCLHDYAPGR